ncbi:DUF6446 family protein [Roseovarius amoyensis]|uniref:DUF6446 family protein n=1 Tax=Roseovarius amoyensis TaxID=2211448 RepID=UPI001EF8F0E5|nr:DUF6446 family protein [Roseovarius amoyensis]
MTGKLMAIAIVVTALVAGVAVYYLQVYAFYERLTPSGPADVQMTVAATGQAEPLAHTDFQAIDADSSPIRYRSCFHISGDPDALTERYLPYDGPVPLQAPGWFDCFDADAIGEALEDGRARAYLGQENIHYGIDRVVAITADGDGYAWHQINACGRVVFDGRPAPEGCPPAPEGY